MKEPDRLELDEAQLSGLEQRLASHRLEPEDYERLAVLLETVRYLGRMVQRKSTSIQRLLRLIFGARTEKTRTVFPPPPPVPPAGPSPAQPGCGEPPPRTPGPSG
jgi:hypothetical protein